MEKLWGFRRLLPLLVACVHVLTTNGAVKTDSLLFEQYSRKLANEIANETIAATMVRMGLLLQDKPYQDKTIECHPAPEELVVNLRAFDCVTFVESVLAMSQLAHDSGPRDFSRFKDNLCSIRYRTLPIEDYTSRIHYTADWIRHNTQPNRGVTNMTPFWGGQQKNKAISFMTSHPHLYPVLRDNPTQLRKMRRIEQEITRSVPLWVIPTSQIAGMLDSLRAGDIVLFAASKTTLDYVHMGIVVVQEGEKRLLHASSVFRKVIVEPRPLLQYCLGQKRISGITILRVTR